ncbi:MAG TPA: VCBS repeat-containing protein [Enhygromyxa sp.]|nr:VCBS repeat-containing protein [Enhygromyxa sp.]
MSLLLVCLGCSPGRIGSDGSGTSSESGLALDSESEDGPVVETDSESDDGEDTDSGGPGPCDREGSLKWLDICEPSDPCDATICEGDLECLGGQCIEPAPTELCPGIELAPVELPVDIYGSEVRLLLADVDGNAGDELISSRTLDGRIDVLLAGQVVTSWIGPEPLHHVVPIQLGGDGMLDLVGSSHGPDPFALVLIGDGQGNFDVAPDQLPGGLPARWPMGIDYDGDGDHDILLAVDQLATQLYRNDGGALSHAGTFDVDVRLGTAVDLDADGLVDDAIFGEYPSPLVLLGQSGDLVFADPLPEPQRGPQLQYGLGRPLAADLDGDGNVEIVTMIADGFGRVGARVWWGQPGNSFDVPRDQMLLDDADGEVSFVDFVELDGQPPVELVINHGDVVSYARPDLANHLPFVCHTSMLEGSFLVDPAIGDLEADGQLEIAVRYQQEPEVYTVVPVP